MAPRDHLYDIFFASTNSCVCQDERVQQLASLIYPLVLEEAKKRWSTTDAQPEPDDFAFDEKVQVTKENLQMISDLFKKLDKDRDEFVSSYPGWSGIRRANVRSLREIGKEMHKIRFSCNVSRLVGSSLGVLGGVALVACFLFPPSATAIVPASLGAGGLAFTGGGVSFGTTATELGLIRTRMIQAKNILKQDQEAFRPMAKYFKHSDELVKAISSVLDIKAMQSLTKDLKKFTHGAAAWIVEKKLSTEFSTVVAKAVGVIFDEGLSVVMGIPKKLASVILTFCIVTIFAHKRNSLILDSIIFSHRLVFGLLDGLNLGAETGRGIAMACNYTHAGKLAADINNQVAKNLFHGIFGAVGLTLDVMNIVLNSIDVHKGSLSKQGTMVLNASDMLRKELGCLNKVYESLKQDDMVIRKKDQTESQF